MELRYDEKGKATFVLGIEYEDILHFSINEPSPPWRLKVKFIQLLEEAYKNFDGAVGNPVQSAAASSEVPKSAAASPKKHKPDDSSLEGPAASSSQVSVSFAVALPEVAAASPTKSAASPQVSESSAASSSESDSSSMQQDVSSLTRSAAGLASEGSSKGKEAK